MVEGRGGRREGFHEGEGVNVVTLQCKVVLSNCGPPGRSGSAATLNGGRPDIRRMDFNTYLETK